MKTPMKGTTMMFRFYQNYAALILLTHIKFDSDIFRCMNLFYEYMTKVARAGQLNNEIDFAAAVNGSIDYIVDNLD
jgi:hypothetical protein